VDTPQEDSKTQQLKITQLTIDLAFAAALNEIWEKKYDAYVTKTTETQATLRKSIDILNEDLEATRLELKKCQEREANPLMTVVVEDNNADAEYKPTLTYPMSNDWLHSALMESRAFNKRLCNKIRSLAGEHSLSVQNNMRTIDDLQKTVAKLTADNVSLNDRLKVVNTHVDSTRESTGEDAELIAKLQNTIKLRDAHCEELRKQTVDLVRERNAYKEQTDKTVSQSRHLGRMIDERNKQLEKYFDEVTYAYKDASGDGYRITSRYNLAVQRNTTIFDSKKAATDAYELIIGDGGGII